MASGKLGIAGASCTEVCPLHSQAVASIQDEINRTSLVAVAYGLLHPQSVAGLVEMSRRARQEDPATGSLLVLADHVTQGAGYRSAAARLPAP